MVLNGVISGTASAFGSVASIRRQWQGIQKRVSAQTAARQAEQQRTGLIRNPDNGDMVEIATLSPETLERWEQRNEIATVSPQEAMIGFMATDPNAEEVERSKALGAIYARLQDKMLAGKKLTGEEKAFLRENYPEMAAMADRMEQEAEDLKRKLQSCESKEDAQRVYLDTKLRIMGERGKDGSNSSILFLMAAVDKAYKEHTEQGKKNVVPKAQNIVPQPQNVVPKAQNIVPQPQNIVPQPRDTVPKTQDNAAQNQNAFRKKKVDVRA